jgi:hypothetical protein
MPSTYTGNLGIELPADGELDGVWGDVVNDNMNIIDRAINGSLALALSGTSSTLTTSDGSLSDGQYKLLVLGGSPSGTHTITIAPSNAQKIYFVRNTTAQSVVFTQGSGGNVTVATGDSAIIYSDGAGAGAAVVNITNDFAMSSVKITGGTIDGTVIGGTSAAAGTFTTANATTVDTTNIEVTTLKAKDGTSAGSIADSTGVVTLASSVLTTTDINGGTIDGTVIGGSSAAAGTFTTVTASGQASFADGTAAAPSITNTGDLDAGLFFPAADTVAVATAGTERMRITSGGNVGIGTSSPDTRVTISASGVNGLNLSQDLGNSALSSRLMLSNATAGQTAIIVNNTGSFAFFTGATVNSSSGTERMRIDTSGNVGIGVSSPTNKLHIVSTPPAAVPAAGTSGHPLAVGTSPYGVAVGTLTDGTGYIQATRWDGAATSYSLLVNPNGGNVGIGTTSPTERLQVGSTASNYIAIAKDGVTSSGIKIIRAGTLDGLFEVDDLERLNIGIDQSGTLGTGVIRFLVGSTERMRIDTTGVVYLGNGASSATPANGFLFATAGSGTDITGATMTLQGGRGTGTGAGGPLIFSTSAAGTTGTTLNAATERMRIISGGNVGIGTTAPAAKLEVALGANGEYMRVGGDDATNNRALRFTSSTSTGSVGALHTINASGSVGVIALATASTERMRISGGVVYLGNGDASATPTNSFLFATAGSGTDIAGASMTIQGGAGTGTGAGGSLNFSTAAAGTTGSSLNAATTRMTINSSGNVGINNSTPGRILSTTAANVILAVNGSITLPFTNTGAEPLRIGSFTNTNFTQGTSSVGNAVGLTVSNWNAVSNGTTAIQAGVDSGNGGIELQSRQTDLGVVTRLARFEMNTSQFFTANAERMRIDSGGNVGIGTSSITAVFGKTVQIGDGTTTSSISLIGTGAGTTGDVYLGSTGSEATLTARASTPLFFGTNGLERMRIDASGNVIIGNGDTSATPTNGILQATGGSGTDIVGATLNIQGGRGTGSANGGPIIFSTAAAGTTGTTLNAATERMRLSAGGNLTVGTTNGTPGSSNVVGAAISALGYISISRDNISAEFNRIASDGDAVVFYRAGTKVGSISVTTTATAYNTSSDYRLKESIQPIFGASDRVRQLNPVNFAWRADGTRTDGFIAHEVQAVAPQAVTGEKDGEEMQAIDHSKLVPLLTAALQEALTEIALLKARLDTANI